MHICMCICIYTLIHAREHTYMHRCEYNTWGLWLSCNTCVRCTACVWRRGTLHDARIPFATILARLCIRVYVHVSIRQHI
jgi:hypothetical protein